jgi:hypothetical protein
VPDAKMSKPSCGMLADDPLGSGRERIEQPLPAG